MPAKGPKKSKPKQDGIVSGAAEAIGNIRRGWTWVLLFVAMIGIAFGAKVTIGQDGLSFVPHLWAKTAEAKPVHPDTTKPDLAREDELNALKASSIPLESLPAELRGDGTRDDAIRLIKELVTAHNDSFATVESCMQCLDYGIVGRRLEINPGKPSDSANLEYEGCVKSLQRCMAILGYYKDPIDGNGSKLLNSVLEFQRSKHLKPDGIVGSRTWLIMKSDLQMALRHPSNSSQTSSMSADASDAQ
jgi:hypothetical protein